MGNLFKLVENDQTGFTNNIKLAKKATFGSFGGDINVIRKFPWTLTPMSEKVAEEVPYIKLKEHYLLDKYINQLFQAYGIRITSENLINDNFENTFDQFTGIPNVGDDRLYEGLYDLDNPTGFTYTLPFFSPNYLNTTNAWTASPMYNQIVELQKKISSTAAAAVTVTGLGALQGLAFLASLTAPGRLIRIAAAAAGIGMDAPGKAQIVADRVSKTVDFATTLELYKAGLESPVASLEDPAIDKPHLWSGTSPYSYTVSFPLFNILDTNPDKPTWSNQIVNNWELCYLLCYQNLYNKRNLFTGIPPVFYEVTIPGIYYTKAAYVSELSIQNVGNIRSLRLPVNEDGSSREINVPDVYMINITLTDFFMPSKNFMDTIENPGNRGRVVESLTTANRIDPVVDGPRDPRTGLPVDAFQNGVGGGGIK